LLAKLEAENQAHFATARKKQLLFKNQLLWQNQKQLTSKQMWLQPILKERKHYLTPQFKFKLYGNNCCN
jgi:hypothetical protein